MRATINGYTLSAAGEVSWTSQPGFDPVVRTFHVQTSIVNRLRERPNEITLQIGDRTIRNLILIGDGPGDGAQFNEKAFSTVTIADRRWLLATKGADVAFNLRRRTGSLTTELQTPGNTGVAPQLLSSFPEEEYYPLTLLDGKPWAVFDAIQYLADQADFPIRNIDPAFPKGDVFTAQGYRGRGMLNVLMMDLLSLVPFWEFSIDDEGVGYFYQQVDFKDPDLTPKRMTEVLRKGHIWGGGAWGKTNLSRVRPQSIRVHFPVEVELLFNYLNDQDLQLAFQSAAPFIPGYAPPAYLESYIQNPVDGLVNPTDPNRTIARGSLINLHVFLQALNEADQSGLIPLPVGAKAKYGPLTIEFMNQFYLSPVTMFGIYTLGERGLTNPLYHRIVTEVRRAYRQNFRMTTQWARSVLAFSNYRIDYLDSISATRRKTNVFCQYSARINEQAGPVRKREDETNHWFSGDLSNTTVERYSLQDVAPADIIIDDQEAKAFHVLFRRGQYGDVEDYIPGLIDVPTSYLNASNLKIEMDHEAPLSSDFQLGTILNCQPVPRHTGTHLFTVEVSPRDAALQAQLPGDAFGPCQGPILDIYVPYDPHMTAKFGFTTFQAQPELELPFFDAKSKFPAGRLSNKPLIEEIAKAYAVSYYYRFLDHYSGAAASPNVGQNATLIGSINSVTSTPTTNTYELSQEVTSADMRNFLTTSTREMLQRLIK